MPIKISPDKIFSDRSFLIPIFPNPLLFSLSLSLSLSLFLYFQTIVLFLYTGELDYIWISFLI